MPIDDILAKIKAANGEKKEELTGEAFRIEEARKANANLTNLNREAAPAPVSTPDRKSHHIKDEYGGNVSDIPVGHSYWQRRFRK